MADASLTVRMALDRLALKQGLDGANADVDGFKKKFETSLRDTRGAVKDVAGSITGIGQAFNGSITGAIGGLRDLIQLIPVSPWAAMGAAAVGAFTAIATHAERTQNAISDAVDKSIKKWVALREETQKLAEENAKLEKDAARPKSPGTEALDYAMRERDIAKENLTTAEKENQRLSERLKLMREAQVVFDAYAKAYGEQAAREKLSPTKATPTGESVSAQRARLQREGALFPADIVSELSVSGAGINKAEEALQKSRLDIEKAKNIALKAEADLTTEREKYADLRKKQIEDEAKDAQQKAEKNQRELNKRVLDVMEDGHREEIEKIEKKNKEKEKADKKRKSGDELRKDLVAGLFEQDAERQAQIAELRQKERASIFDKGDIYQRMGGQVGANLSPALREADLKSQREKEMVELMRRSTEASVKIEKAFYDALNKLED